MLSKFLLQSSCKSLQVDGNWLSGFPAASISVSRKLSRNPRKTVAVEEEERNEKQQRPIKRSPFRYTLNSVTSAASSKNRKPLGVKQLARLARQESNKSHINRAQIFQLGSMMKKSDEVKLLPRRKAENMYKFLQPSSMLPFGTQNNYHCPETTIQYGMSFRTVEPGAKGKAPRQAMQIMYKMYNSSKKPKNRL